MKILALNNIKDEIITGKLYECLEDSSDGYLILNELNEFVRYEKILFGILPIEPEKPTKNHPK